MTVSREFFCLPQKVLIQSLLLGLHWRQQLGKFLQVSVLQSAIRSRDNEMRINSKAATSRTVPTLRRCVLKEQQLAKQSAKDFSRFTQSQLWLSKKNSLRHRAACAGKLYRSSHQKITPFIYRSRRNLKFSWLLSIIFCRTASTPKNSRSNQSDYLRHRGD